MARKKKTRSVRMDQKERPRDRASDERGQKDRDAAYPSQNATYKLGEVWPREKVVIESRRVGKYRGPSVAKIILDDWES